MKGFTVDHLNATVHEDIYCVPAWIKIKKDTRLLKIGFLNNRQKAH